MVFTPSFAAVAVAVLLALPAVADNPSGLYTKKSPVVQVTAKTYDRLIAQSNQSAVSSIYIQPGAS
jgi:protein disulfide-isomerase A6